MKLGIRAHDLGRQSAESLPRAVRAEGFDAVQLALAKAVEGVANFADVNSTLLDRVRLNFASQNVEISVLGCYIEPSLPNSGERLRQVGNFLLGLEHARDLGVTLVGTETTHLAPTPENETRREKLYHLLRDSVLRMAEKAEKLDVDIGIEPVAEHTLNTPELARRLLDEVGSERVKIIFDPVNMLLADNADRQEEVFGNFLNLLGQDVRILHVKDVVFENGEKVWRPIGQGMVNQRFVFDWMRANMPDIPAIREDARADSFAPDLAAMREFAGVIL